MSGGCRVLLIGMMGSGKSTIGRLLSEATGWPYLDNDELVRRAHGLSARELLAARGAPAMRDAESAALRLGLTIEPPAIIGVAAGVVLSDADRRALDRGGLVVWLDAAPETLAARAGGADHRPWLEEDPVAWMRQALGERGPIYRSVADLTLATDDEPPPATADRLLDWLGAEGPCAAQLRA